MYVHNDRNARYASSVVHFVLLSPEHIYNILRTIDVLKINIRSEFRVCNNMSRVFVSGKIKHFRMKSCHVVKYLNLSLVLNFLFCSMKRWRQKKEDYCQVSYSSKVEFENFNNQ